MNKVDLAVVLDIFCMFFYVSYNKNLYIYELELLSMISKESKKNNIDLQTFKIIMPVIYRMYYNDILNKWYQFC